MGDEGFYDGDLTGRWVGHYAHLGGYRADQEFPIEAEIACRDGRVEGRMIDEITEFVDDYGKLVDATSESLGVFSRLMARRFAGDHPGALLRVKMPREARLDGRLRGFDLRLFKTYQGRYTVALEERGQSRIVVDRGEHRVEYRGTLDVSGPTIEGMWLIRPRGWLGRLRKPMARGEFRLEKGR